MELTLGEILSISLGPYPVDLAAGYLSDIQERQVQEGYAAQGNYADLASWSQDAGCLPARIEA